MQTIIDESGNVSVIMRIKRGSDYCDGCELLHLVGHKWYCGLDEVYLDTDDNFSRNVLRSLSCSSMLARLDQDNAQLKEGD